MAKRRLTIWKYPLEITDEQFVDVPRGAAPLTVDFQGDQLCMWAYVDPGNEKSRMRVHIYGTGNPIPPGRAETYVGTASNDGLVWHVFRDDWQWTTHGDDR